MFCAIQTTIFKYLRKPSWEFSFKKSRLVAKVSAASIAKKLFFQPWPRLFFLAFWNDVWWPMSVIGESRGISEKLRGFFENIFCVLYVLCTLYILVFYTSTISTYLRKKQKTKLIVLTITFDVKQLKTINPAEGVENVINLFFLSYK